MYGFSSTERDGERRAVERRGQAARVVLAELHRVRRRELPVAAEVAALGDAPPSTAASRAVNAPGSNVATMSQ